jgi:putative ABC transport system permease protein
MFTATIRGMFAHRLRLVLTTASITLGVAFLAGTLILTDTMYTAYEQLHSKVSAGTDAVVREKAAYSASGDSQGVGNKPISSTVVSQVRHVHGVRAAQGTVDGYALLTDSDGKAILPGAGADSTGSNWVTDDKLRGDIALNSGHAPTRPDEVVIDAHSADSHHIALGTSVNILFHDAAQRFTVVGTVMFGDAKDIGGSTAAYFETDAAQRLIGRPGTFEQVIVSADPDVTQAQLAARIRAVLPGGAEVITGAALAKEFSVSIHESLNFLTILLEIFAGVALFVGAFIIWNTFTMTVIQRSRETALLRAVGATRGQVRRSIATEALVLGLSASALGVLVGVGVAKGLSALMSAVGFSLPTTSTQVEPRTVWVSLIVGTVVTVVAALAPARRATKVLPVEALREATPGTGGTSRLRAVSGLLLTAAGAAALVSGLFGGSGIALVGLGVVGIILGITTLGPFAARPLGALIGAPLRARGVPGDLARQNAMRNPRRTSSTAAALMIGLALVVSVSVFAASLKAVFGDVLNESTKADLYIAPASVSGPGFSTDVVPIVAAVPGVKIASPNSFGTARFDGSGAGYASVDPATAQDVLNLDVSAGSARNLGTHGILVAKKTAASHGWKMGSTIDAEFASTGMHHLTVVGIYGRTTGYIADDYIISVAAQVAYDGTRLDSGGLVVLDKGADRATVQKAIEAALATHPDARVLTLDEFKAVTGTLVDNLLIFVSVMLLLAVIIAFLGIVNTLALSVFERTRELGLLRAVGLTRGQVRAMVRWESVVISLIGAVAGAALGAGLGAALVRAARDVGFKGAVIPYGQIALYLAIAAGAGILAAVGPARSAAKVDVLKAVVTD